MTPFAIQCLAGSIVWMVLLKRSFFGPQRMFARVSGMTIVIGILCVLQSESVYDTYEVMGQYILGGGMLLAVAMMFYEYRYLKGRHEGVHHDNV